MNLCIELRLIFHSLKFKQNNKCQMNKQYSPVKKKILCIKKRD